MNEPTCTCTLPATLVHDDISADSLHYFATGFAHRSFLRFMIPAADGHGPSARKCVFFLIAPGTSPPILQKRISKSTHDGDLGIAHYRLPAIHESGSECVSLESVYVASTDATATFSAITQSVATGCPRVWRSLGCVDIMAKSIDQAYRSEGH